MASSCPSSLVSQFSSLEVAGWHCSLYIAVSSSECPWDPGHAWIFCEGCQTPPLKAVSAPRAPRPACSYRDSPRSRAVPPPVRDSRQLLATWLLCPMSWLTGLLLNEPFCDSNSLVWWKASKVIRKWRERRFRKTFSLFPFWKQPPITEQEYRGFELNCVPTKIC